MTQQAPDAQPAGQGPAGVTPAAPSATTAAGTAPEENAPAKSNTAPLQDQPELGAEVVLGPGAKGDVNNPAARDRVDERTGKIVGADTEEEKAE